MILQQKNKKWRIVDVIFLLLLPFFSNAATPEESKEEILFVTSYNSDTKYTYDNINTFVETYRLLGGKYSTIVENMNATDLNQASGKKRSPIFWINTRMRNWSSCWEAKRGAASCTSKMRSTNSFPYFVLWQPATVSAYRKIPSIYRLMILQAST